MLTIIVLNTFYDLILLNLTKFIHDYEEWLCDEDPWLCVCVSIVLAKDAWNASGTIFPVTIQVVGSALYSYYKLSAKRKFRLYVENI